ncbi:MAG: alpha/beta hydrolase [Cardiobacteriaceae bacterium]|nr:alpha/beta hydrolase [Cardiobacteriaceae bacterium]
MEKKSLHLLVGDYRNTDVLQPMLEQSYVEQNIATIQAMRFKLADADPIQPDHHWVAPADNKQSPVSLYVFLPQSALDKPLPLIYFMHGGGYILGNPRQQNAALKALAEQNQAMVVSVGYTLATTKPYPADLNDAYHGLHYLYQHAAQYGIDAEKIIVMGESAGGGLAARLALKVRDEGEISLKGQVLIYPMLDYRTGTAESPYPNAYTGEFVWTAERNRFGWSCLRGGQTFSLEELGYFSPTFAQKLSALPPTFIVVSTLDLFVHEDIDYAQRLIQAGVPTELHVIDGAYHGFDNVLPQSEQTQQYIHWRTQAIARMLSR